MRLLTRNNLILIILGLLFSISTIELILRLFGVVDLEDENTLQDDYLGFKFKPNVDVVTANADGMKFNLKTISLGFENIGFRDDGVNGEPFAVAIGDSYTLNFGEMEDGWVETLEKKLGKDVVNMGVHMYSSIQEKRVLEKYGLKLKPKLIIWQFFINDFIDSYKFYQVKNVSKPIKNILYENLMVFKFAWDNLGKLKHDSEIIVYKDENISLTFWPQPYLDDISPELESVKTGETLSKNAILEAKGLAENNGAKFLMIIIPSKEQVYWYILERLISDKDVYKFNYTIETMERFCMDNGITCLNLTPIFIENAKMNKSLYFPIDAHLNKLGNEVAANSIYDFIVANN